MNRRGSSTAIAADSSTAFRDAEPQRARTISWLHPRAGFYRNGNGNGNSNGNSERGWTQKRAD
jgi:hypothetical protein